MGVVQAGAGTYNPGSGSGKHIGFQGKEGLLAQGRHVSDEEGVKEGRRSWQQYAWVWCKLGREPTTVEVVQVWSREQRKRRGEEFITGKAFLNQYETSGGVNGADSSTGVVQTGEGTHGF